MNADFPETPSHGTIGLGESRARAFVWCVWSMCFLASLTYIGVYRPNVPLGHDVDMVPELTGQRPITPGALWEQNNEHRTFLPRVIIIGLNEITNCNFRAPCFFHIVCLAVLSLALILVARRTRGYTSFVDAFFPLLLLSLGNCIACFEARAHVAAGVLACAGLLVVILQGHKFKWRSALTYGICLLLLPLCASGGVAHAAVGVLILLGAAVIRWRTGDPGWKRDVIVMAALATAVIALVIFYFHGFLWRDLPRNMPSVVSNMLCFWAICVGAGGSTTWQLTSLVVLLFTTQATVLLIRSLIVSPGKRLSAAALLSFLAATAAIAASIAWSRACLGPTAAMGFRFTVLATPLLCAVFLTFQLHASKRVAFGCQAALFVIVLAFLPANVSCGFKQGRIYQRTGAAILRDAELGVPPGQLAVRNHFFRRRKLSIAMNLQLLLKHGTGCFAETYRSGSARAAAKPNTPPANPKAPAGKPEVAVAKPNTARSKPNTVSAKPKARPAQPVTVSARPKAAPTQPTRR